tara:strand:- start:1467 stop:3854 length:2388 start_codon:yes stop_codon:yes gene_type:complete
MNSNLSNFPRQKLADSSKNEKWWKECIDTATYVLRPNNEYIRKSYNNKQANYDLRVGKLNFNDLKAHVDIMEIGMKALPDTFRHIGRGNAYINLLIGEEISRGTNFKVFISSSDTMGISQKEDKLKELTLSHINDQLMRGKPELDEKSFQKFQHFSKYEWQDFKEITGAKILKAEYQRNRIDRLFTQAFEDGLTCGEEIACAELHGFQPIARRCNPLNIYTLSSGGSNKIEDADIIIEYQFLSIGQVIDRYYRYLKPKDIEMLEGKGATRANLVSGNPSPMSFSKNPTSNLLIIDPENSELLNNNWDANGNIRIATVNWRSRRKLQELKYYDEFGYEQFKYVHEEYIVDEDSGEEAEDVWVNEWWEGTKIGGDGEDLYVNVKPIAYRGASLANVSKGLPNYIGQIYNINGGPAQSMIDIIKPIDYSYDLVFWKRDKAIAAHLGTPLLINSSMVPSDWDPDLWLDYLVNKQVGWLDPTQEIMKGPAQGKSAGMFNTLTATQLDGSSANDISLWTNVLLSLEDTLGKITGISPQREAQTSSSETLGGVQRSLNQSAHITEKWFAYHEDFKQRFLTKYLELVKYAYKKNPQVAQYVLDDASLQIVKNYDEFLESDYDVHISNARADQALMEMLKSHAQAALQNQMLTYSDIAMIWKSESTQDIAKKLENSRDKIIQEQQSIKQQESEGNMNIQKAKEEFEKYKLENDNNQKELDRQNKYNIAELQAWSKNSFDADSDGIPDVLELEKFQSGVAFKREKLMEESRLKEKNIQSKEKIVDKTLKNQKEIAATKSKLTIKK